MHFPRPISRSAPLLLLLLLGVGIAALCRSSRCCWHKTWPRASPNTGLVARSISGCLI